MSAERGGYRQWGGAPDPAEWPGAGPRPVYPAKGRRAGAFQAALLGLCDVIEGLVGAAAVSHDTARDWLRDVDRARDAIAPKEGG